MKLTMYAVHIKNKKGDLDFKPVMVAATSPSAAIALVAETFKAQGKLNKSQDVRFTSTATEVKAVVGNSATKALQAVS